MTLTSVILWEYDVGVVDYAVNVICGEHSDYIPARGGGSQQVE